MGREFTELGFSLSRWHIDEKGFKVFIPEDENSEEYCVQLPDRFTFYQMNKLTTLQVLRNAKCR